MNQDNAFRQTTINYDKEIFIAPAFHLFMNSRAFSGNYY